MSPKPTPAGSKLGKKLGLIFLAFFALPFAAAGTFAVYKAIENLTHGKISDGLQFSVLGIILSGAGYGMITHSFFRLRSIRRLAALQVKHPNKPLLWRDDWATRRIPSSSKGGMMDVWILAIIWNLVSVAVFIGVLSQMSWESPIVWFATLYPLIGLGLFIWAIRNSICWIKYGHVKSRFILTVDCGTIGDHIAGNIETSIKLRPKNGFHLTLRCIEIDSGGESITEHLRWENDKTIIRDTLDDPRSSRIPVFFQIPSACPPTDASVSNHRIVWRLEVRAEFAGPDYVAQFEVPVFERASTATAPTLISDPTLPYQQPYRRPTTSPIKIRALSSGATEFYFPPARNKGPAISLFLFLLVCIGFTVIGFEIRDHAPVALIFGGIAIILLLFAPNLLIKSSRITIDNFGLHSRQSWLLFRSKRQFARDEIISIETKIGMTAGDKAYYDIKVVTTGNRSSSIATSIQDKKEAQWLASEMLGLIGGRSKASLVQNPSNT